MECLSHLFVMAVGSLLDEHNFVIATIAVKGSDFIARTKARPDVEVWELRSTNRDELPWRLASLVRGIEQ